MSVKKKFIMWHRYTVYNVRVVIQEINQNKTVRMFFPVWYKLVWIRWRTKILPFQRKFTQRKLLYIFIVIRNIYDRHQKKYRDEETAYLLGIFAIDFLNKSIVCLSKKVISTKQILDIALFQARILSQEEDIAVLFLFWC